MTDTTALLTTRPDDRAHLDALREQLLARARHEQLLDIAYRSVDTPLGPLLVATTPVGIVRVGLPNEDPDDVLGELAEHVSPRVLAAARPLDDAARQLDDYFAGIRTAFELPLDLRLVTGFRRDVVRALPSIGYGRTTTYGALAQQLGRPAAARAVGTGCARNPVPVVVPCHRVLPSAGGVGSYRGGPAAKEQLLVLEGAR